MGVERETESRTVTSMWGMGEDPWNHDAGIGS